MKHLPFFFFIFSIYLTAQTNNDSSGYYYNKSAAAYRQKDYPEFLSHTQKAISYDKDNISLRYNLACAYALNNNSTGAVEILAAMVKDKLELAFNAETDADFSSIRETEEFKQLLEKIKEAKIPVVNSTTAFTINEKDLIPEGIAYDPVKKVFYLSSLYKYKILKIDFDGNVSEFKKEREDGLVPTLGMRTDAKRRILWVVSSSSAPRENLPEEVVGTSGLFKYDLTSGRLVKKYMLPQNEKHFLNDITVAPNGDVYATDSHVPAVYLVKYDKDEIEKFVDLAGEIYPNGIDITPDGSKLFVATNNILIIDTKTRKIQTLKHPKNIMLSADGLYLYKNSLIAVQNVFYNRIAQFFLNDTFEEVIDYKILESYNPIFNIPTTGAIAKDNFYFIANSQLGSFDAGGKIFPTEKLNPVKILKLSLR
ncbi:MAG: SMP-30/gluconolactonase/LRE family protein [Bacteroidota bacterium]